MAVDLRKKKACHTIRAGSGALLTIHLGDCLKSMERHLEPGSVSIVVTSPPYNIGVGYGTYDDTVSREDYLAWIESWARKVTRLLHRDGSIFLNMGSRPADPWGPFEVLQRLRPLFELQNVIHWIKSIYIEHFSYGRRVELNIGHYKPVNSQRFLNDCHEYVFHLTHHGKVPLDRKAIGIPYKDQSNVTRWGEAASGVRCRGNCWYIPYETILRRDRDRPHPASFPPKLAEMCIRLHGVSRTRLVLDPFMGIGNTALACRDLGVDFVGFEIDRKYFEETERRIRTEQMQLNFPDAQDSFQADPAGGGSRLEEDADGREKMGGQRKHGGPSA